MMELFEREPSERVAVIRRVLQAERRMRMQVFEKKPDMLLKKVGEIDSALNELDRLEEVIRGMDKT